MKNWYPLSVRPHTDEVGNLTFRSISFGMATTSCWMTTYNFGLSMYTLGFKLICWEISVSHSRALFMYGRKKKKVDYKVCHSNYLDDLAWHPLQHWEDRICQMPFSELNKETNLFFFYLSHTLNYKLKKEKMKYVNLLRFWGIVLFIYL